MKFITLRPTVDNPTAVRYQR